VLVGIVWGLFNAMLNMTYQMAPALFGWPSPPGWLVSLQPLAGTAMAFVAFATMINLSLVNGLVATFVITLLRRISASIWVVVPLSMLIFGLLGDPATTVETGRLRLLLFGIVTAFVPAIVTMRYGLLAVLSAALASNLTQNLAFTLDPDRAYFQISLIPAIALGAVALAAWRLSRGSGDAIITAQ
jgi:hypothetical protein